jgi:hypothetical protein
MLSTAPRSYRVPAGLGVVTQLRHRTGTVSGTLTVKVYRPTGVESTTTSWWPPRRVRSCAGTTHAFAVRAPVHAGDVLGLSTASGVQRAYAGASSDTQDGCITGLPDLRRVRRDHRQEGAEEDGARRRRLCAGEAEVPSLALQGSFRCSVDGKRFKVKKRP